MTSTEFMIVAARIRPSASAVAQERVVEVIDKKNICFNPRNSKRFSFDAVFDENVTQEQVFEELGSRIVDGCVDGFNGTIFAYGQTGSGKTHTMLGPPQVENFLLSSEHRGLIPRACDALFTKLCARAAEKGENFKYEVICKFVELHNEELYDLLSASRCQQELSIWSDSKVVQLIGVSEHTVHSVADMKRILELGWEARRAADSAVNRESSPSHTIFIVDIKTEELVNTTVNKKSATLNLVDLAGSERQTQAETVGDRFEEAVHINLSLSVLGRVIRTLSTANRRGEHIPYSGSKLTHILRDSLGGNSRTAVIVNVHPDAIHQSHTLTTLQFAAECRKIENRVHVNEDLSGDTVIAYKSEIARLRAALKTVEEKTRAEMMSKLTLVEDELKTWKRIAIAREKLLVEALLHLTAARRTITSGEGHMKETFSEEVDDANKANTAHQKALDDSNELCDEIDQLEADSWKVPAAKSATTASSKEDEVDGTTRRESSSSRSKKDKSCPYCPRNFSSMQNRLRHIKNRHPERVNDPRTVNHTYIKARSKDLPFECQECFKAFRRKCGLNLHNRRVHENRNDHVCTICFKGFPIRSEMRQHMQRAHKKE